MILIALLISSFYPARTLIAKRNQLAAMKRQSASLDRQIEALRSQRDWLQTDEAVQQLARSTLGMVEPGETAFAVVPGRGLAPAPVASASAAATQRSPSGFSRWWHAFAGAIKLAK
jgi:cell division protein FtsL